MLKNTFVPGTNTTHTMKRLLSFALLLPALAVAKVPVEEDILDRITDTSSPYYYTGLMMRYNAGDETLTDEDYHYLYYGPDAPDVGTLEAIISAGTDALARDPFSPKLLNLMSYAYGALGDKERERAYSNRMNGIVRTILSSGDGFTQKTPRHILMFDHALDVLTVEGFSYDKSRVISRTVEFVPLTSPYVVEGKKRRGFYFDFSRIYRNKPEGYTYKRDRTWQFNNLKPRTYK